MSELSSLWVDTIHRIYIESGIIFICEDGQVKYATLEETKKETL